ncbi:hypothetical protein B0H13DRAFT_1857224 [Mycena leptocephala]|nr:hypothetical protein B0H13DRAFT_1857224 [Mycena leptocephala]
MPSLQVPDVRIRRWGDSDGSRAVGTVRADERREKDGSLVAWISWGWTQREGLTQRKLQGRGGDDGSQEQEGYGTFRGGSANDEPSLVEHSKHVDAPLKYSQFLPISLEALSAQDKVYTAQLLFEHNTPPFRGLARVRPYPLAWFKLPLTSKCETKKNGKRRADIDSELPSSAQFGFLFLGIKMLDEDSIFLLSQSGGTEERFARDNQESINRSDVLPFLSSQPVLTSLRETGVYDHASGNLGYSSGTRFAAEIWPSELVSRIRPYSRRSASGTLWAYVAATNIVKYQVNFGILARHELEGIVPLTLIIDRRILNVGRPTGRSKPGNRDKRGYPLPYSATTTSSRFRSGACTGWDITHAEGAQLCLIDKVLQMDSLNEGLTASCTSMPCFTETILADAALKAIESETTENYRQEIKRKGMLIEAEKDSGKLLDLGKMALEAHLHRVLIKALPIGLAKASTLDVRSLMISLEIWLAPDDNTTRLYTFVGKMAADQDPGRCDQWLHGRLAVIIAAIQKAALKLSAEIVPEALSAQDQDILSLAQHIGE